MLGNFIGHVEWPAAIALVALFLGIGIPITVWVASRNTRTDDDYELEVLKAKGVIAENQYRSETNRIIEEKKLSQNLITSHRAE